MRRTLAALLVFCSLTVAGTAFAGDFVPIVPLPNPSGGVSTDAGSLGEYLNAGFTLALAVGAVFAVINIGIGGFEYMMSEAVTKKGDGRTKIMQSLFGLIILLVVYLVLFVINPDILNLDLFRSRPST